MKWRLTVLLWCGFGCLLPSSHSQEPEGRVVVVKPQDLKRTAHRLRISVEQLVNARTALNEATELSLRLDPTAQMNYAELARLWLQVDRRKSREVLGSIIARLFRQAEDAETLELYRQYGSQAQNLLGMLGEIDPENAEQIAALWPPPPSRLGDAGAELLAQFKNESLKRLLRQNVYATPDQVYEQLQRLPNAASITLQVRSDLAQALISSNQKDKAREVLDQGIEELANRPPGAGNTSEYGTMPSPRSP